MNEELKAAYERASGNAVRGGVVYDSGGHVVDADFDSDAAIEWLLSAYADGLDEMVIEEKCAEAATIIQCGQKDMVDYLEARGWDREATALHLVAEAAED